MSKKNKNGTADKPPGQTPAISGLVHNNRNLVRLAHTLRHYLQEIYEIIETTTAVAVPIAAAHEKQPVEYVIPAAEMARLNDVKNKLNKHHNLWPDDPPPTTLHLQQTCGCCGVDFAPDELEEHIGMVMYCRHCLNNDLVPRPAMLNKHGHHCYICDGLPGPCPDCAKK